MNDNVRQGIYALIVAGLVVWCVGWAVGHDAHRGDDLPPDVAAALEDARDGKIGEPEAGAPPKELRPGMAWEVTGAGDSSYDGVYEESGTYNGQPAYTNGSKWLFWGAKSAPLDCWCLSLGVEAPTDEMYHGELDTALPGGVWVVIGGAAPAPTVAEYEEPPAPPTPPNLNDTDTKRTGWIPGMLSPAQYPCQVVKPCRLTSDGLEYAAFLGIAGDAVNLYCVDNGTWTVLRGPDLSPIYKFLVHENLPHPCLLHAGDGETVWFALSSAGSYNDLENLRAFPLTLDIANLAYTVGSEFAPGIAHATDLAVDDANTAWFIGADFKLYSWDLTGASLSEEADWSTGRTDHGAHAGARFWYSGTAGEFFHTRNPYYGHGPDYIHQVSDSVYEWTGESVQDICFSYDHHVARNLTYAVGTQNRSWRYKPSSGDAWQGAGISNATDHVWVLRGDVMMLAGINETLA